MTAADAAQGQPTAPDYAMMTDGLMRIGRTTWVKAAIAAQVGADCQLVKPYQAADQFREDFAHFVSTRPSSFDNWSVNLDAGWVTAAALAITT